MTNTAILSVDLCHTAWGMVRPSVEHCMTTPGLFNRFEGIGVVLNPTKRFEPKYDHGSLNDAFIRDVPYFSWTLGPVPAWQHPYHSIAMRKAWATFKYRLPSRVIQQSHPYLFEADMTKWGGSVIDPASGLIVAFSGVQQHFDELISMWMLSTIQMLSINRMLGVMDSPLSVFEDEDCEHSLPDGDDPSGLLRLHDLLGLPMDGEEDVAGTLVS